jgi:hypothetical protein
MSVGDHICAFYRGEEERDQIFLPYLREGLRAGDACICVLDSSDPDQVRVALGKDAQLESRRMQLLSSEESYLAGGGFSPDTMMSFWVETAQATFDEGYEFMRAVGEMTWALRDMPGVDSLVAYEAELNRFLPKFPQTILCLYDLERFTNGELLIDILRTHPKVLMSRMVVDNPWYIEPDEFLARGM